MLDDIDLHDGKIPNYYLEHKEERTREELDKLTSSENDYIEIKMGAKDALHLLKEAIDI